jgi:Asp-tRNA(Asn)/Glu-tRNA(Gln) amidotransferase A subunit family amidase
MEYFAQITLPKALKRKNGQGRGYNPAHPMKTPLRRRTFLSYCSRAGFAATLFPGVLWALNEEKGPITKELINQAATVADIKITPEQSDMMLKDLNDALKDYEAIHALNLPNDVPPAFLFNPLLPGMKLETEQRPMRISRARAVGVPKNLEDAAFYTVRQWAELIRTKKVSSVALTEMYLSRLKRYDPVLLFSITLTEDRALAQAKEADKEIAAGKYRGPLHGIPWGAKDLLAVKGYRTTWGAGGMEKQMVDQDATVVKRLDQAGAVLIAKLTLGALAMDDGWFGGKTRNPWNTEQGSSGSSAGPASATASGCVGFSIGSETLGSIASPSTRCGCTGLRPTFGRVPRTGAMALSWTMDKLGPICRAVEDCALVLDAIHGPDGQDWSVKPAAFNWDATLDAKTLRVGYMKAEFEKKPGDDETKEDKEAREERAKFDEQALDVLRTKLRIDVKPVTAPDFPFGHLSFLLNAEAGAAFDELTRSGRDKLLTGQTKDDWPNIFRESHFIPAVEYVNANRARYLGMQKWAEMFANFDVIVAPTFGDQLVITNLTGNPALILPNGFRKDGTPTSITLLGQLYDEAKLLAVARAYQDATDWHLKYPPKFAPAVSKQERASVSVQWRARAAALR